MSAPQPDQIAALVDALREDLPDACERERMRARLIAAGVALSGGVAASGAASVAAAATTTASAGAASGAQLGLWPKLVSLSFAQKVGVAVVLVSAGAALPAAPKLIEVVERASAHAASVEVRPAQRPHATRVHVAAAPDETQDSAAPALPSTRSATTAREPQVGQRAPAAGPAPEVTIVALVAAAPVREVTPSAARASAATKLVAKSATLATERVPDVSRVSADVAAASAISPAKEERSDLASSAPPAAAADMATTPADAPAQDEPAATPAAAPPAGALAARLSPAAAARAASTLRDETELLEHALAAIAAGDRTSARAWLDLHAQRFPHGLLERERQRALQRLARMRAGASPNPTTGASTP
jgi:hypothetical protein